MFHRHGGRRQLAPGFISMGRNPLRPNHAFGHFDTTASYRPFPSLFDGNRSRLPQAGDSRDLLNFYLYGHVSPHDVDRHRAGDRPLADRPRPAGVEPNKPGPSDKGVLRVEKVDFKVKENTKEHRTNEYDISEDPVNPQLVVRRGQQFIIEITFNKPYDVLEDDLRLVFGVGDDPKESKGTQVVFILSAKDEKNKWGAAISQQAGETLAVAVFTPPDCIVGKWNLSVDVVKQKDEKTTIFRYKHNNPIYILFNPWCKADPVYLENDRDRREYVLNDKGKLFMGSFNSISAKPWVFGQFTGNVLDCCMHILDISDLKMPVRGNPIPVVRKLTAMINAQDEGGVLSGNWSGSYEGGTSPLAWTGSVAILEQFYKQKYSVQFGQCWVFSGVLTTVLRALGIPARSVTNFKSAHDSDGSITIDSHFDMLGNPMDGGNDSVWNFHVWNEVWMSRPDLPAGYGGWQACDATPQEASDNVYCCGPCPVLAIKQGEVNLPYDAPFVFAEVNADKVFWQQQADGTLKVISQQKNVIGMFISTMGPRGDRVDVTREYKFPEESTEERVAVLRANQVGSTRKDIYTEGPKDVEFELVSDATNQFVGDDFVVTLSCKNNSQETRTLCGTMKARTMFYTGVVADEVGSEKLNGVAIPPGQKKDVVVTVTARDYERHLKDGCMLSVSCLAKVTETEQIFVDIEEMRLRKPHLQIKSPATVKLGDELEIQLSFTNPMPSTLTKCYLEVECPGITDLTKYPQRDVLSKGTFLTTLKLKPQKPGPKQIVAIFNSSVLEDINGTFDVIVTE